MESIKSLIREVHRRSLWQVLGIFLAASWGVLQVVEVLTETAGLPDWTPTMALVALLLGLPVCLATAFVQEGMPGREDGSGELSPGGPSSREGLPENLAAGTGSLDRPTTRPSRVRRLFTWRNALLGGLGAFAVLGVVLAAYFTMWTVGIGPVGNLVAQGVISRGEKVLLADFTDATGEGLGNSVTSLLRADLLDASVLDLVEAADISATLTLMRVAPGTPLTREVALEVAAREGIGAIIDGEVTAAGSGYIIAATLRGTDNARSIASFRTTAESPDAVIPAIVQLSEEIRSKSGESLRTIRAGNPLERATTSSLEALKLYTEAEWARDNGENRRSVELLQQALVRDSTFAMAWRLLFITSRDTDAATRAFQLRERLPDLERFVVEGLYYEVVAGDRASAEAAYESALDIDPSELRSLNNLGALYAYRGDLEGARDLYVRAVEAGRSISTPQGNLRSTLIDLGSFEDAASNSPDIQNIDPDSDLRGFAFDLAFAKGDLLGAANFVGDRSGDPGQLNDIRDVNNQARLALWTGRLDEARRLNLRAEELHPPGDWVRRITTARTEIHAGDPVWGRQHLTEAGFEDRPPLYASLDLAFSGDPSGAQSLLDYWKTMLSAADQAKPNVVHNLDHWSLFVRVARGDTVGAVEAFRRVSAAEGCADSCWPSHEARLYDDLGLHDQAIELHERMLRPGYRGWGGANIDERLRSMLRLGPLYEETGDTTKAIEAYRRVVEQWADADARGQEVVRRFRERIGALGG